MEKMAVVRSRNRKSDFEFSISSYVNDIMLTIIENYDR